MLCDFGIPGLKIRDDFSPSTSAESASKLDLGTAMGAPEKDGGGLTGTASSGDVMDGR